MDDNQDAGDYTLYKLLMIPVLSVNISLHPSISQTLVLYLSEILKNFRILLLARALFPNSLLETQTQHLVTIPPTTNPNSKPNLSSTRPS